MLRLGILLKYMPIFVCFGTRACVRVVVFVVIVFSFLKLFNSKQPKKRTITIHHKRRDKLPEWK